MSSVRVIEVGPRDGLQNEPTTLQPAVRAELIRRLLDAGLSVVEAGSFVSPAWVPQMSDTDQVLQAVQDTLPQPAAVELPVLVPNLKGYQRALAAGARSIALAGSASETFSLKNINCSIADSLIRFHAIAARARHDGIRMRGYVSCLVACPYEGPVSSRQVMPVVREFLAMGCHEVSLGDTIGHGSPSSIKRVLSDLLSEIPASRLAMHCHDTFGTAIANIVQGLDQGIRAFDASVGGIGGCPFATGAGGNVATEDLVYLLHREGLTSGVDLEHLVATGKWLHDHLGRLPSSRVSRAMSPP